MRSEAATAAAGAAAPAVAVCSVQCRWPLCPGIDRLSSVHLDTATIVAVTTASARPLSTMRGARPVTMTPRSDRSEPEDGQ